MKAIMISIKPEWVAKILNGEKTIEVRKTMPKCKLPIDVYIYCTKSSLKVSGKYGYKKHLEMIKTDLSNGTTESTILNGKVVAKFTLNKVEEIAWQSIYKTMPFRYLLEESGYGTHTIKPKDFIKLTCLSIEQLTKYLNTDKVGARAYAIHISNLEIFDKPKELGEFKHLIKYHCNNCPYSKCIGHYMCMVCEEYVPLTKAPQSWCYVEV